MLLSKNNSLVFRNLFKVSWQGHIESVVTPGNKITDAGVE